MLIINFVSLKPKSNLAPKKKKNKTKTNSSAVKVLSYD